MSALEACACRDAAVSAFFLGGVHVESMCAWRNRMQVIFMASRASEKSKRLRSAIKLRRIWSRRRSWLDRTHTDRTVISVCTDRTTEARYGECAASTVTENACHSLPSADSDTRTISSPLRSPARHRRRRGRGRGPGGPRSRTSPVQHSPERRFHIMSLPPNSESRQNSCA